MSNKKIPDQLLDEAIEVKDLKDVKRAIKLGADVVRLHEETKVPLFQAIHDDPILALIVKTIVAQSQILKNGVPNKEKTQKVLKRNLLNRTNKGTTYGDVETQTFIHIATGWGMLPLVWNHLKGLIDIHALHEDGKSLIREVANFPERFAYLIGEGVSVDERDGNGETPVMRTLAQSSQKSLSSMKEMLAIYEKNHADVHAVDNKKQGLAHHLLKVSDIMENNGVRAECLDWLLAKGVNFLAKDNTGKVATDYLDDTTNYLYAVFSKLATYGYSFSALAETCSAKSKILEIREAFEKFLIRDIGEQLAAPNLAARLWNPGSDTPSTLLLSAFGYGVVRQIFENSYYRNDLPAARALYQTMKEKLPHQCQETLRTGIDLSFLRDEKRPSQSSAIANALKRKAPSVKPRGGERQLGQ